jgi:hypothetical protein
MTPTHTKILGLLLVTTGLAVLPQPARSLTAPPGFVVVNAFPTASFNLPVLVVFMPDGRRLVVEKEGRIWMVTAAGAKLPAPVISPPTAGCTSFTPPIRTATGPTTTRSRSAGSSATR